MATHGGVRQGCGRKKEEYTRVHILVTPTTAEKLNFLSRRLGKAKGKVINEAIEDFYNKIKSMRTKIKTENIHVYCYNSNIEIYLLGENDINGSPEFLIRVIQYADGCDGFTYDENWESLKFTIQEELCDAGDYAKYELDEWGWQKIEFECSTYLDAWSSSEE